MGKWVNGYGALISRIEIAKVKIMSTSDKKPGDSARPIEPQSGLEVSQNEGLDPGSRAVADALRLTFGVLKLVMVCLVVVFIWNGFYRVEESKVAIQLRFGKVHGTGAGRIKEPRSFPYWKWPDPIDEVIKVPSSKVVRYMNIDSFWYDELTPRPDFTVTSRPYIPLLFAKDGYCLTASASGASRSKTGVGSPQSASGADYNIAHTKWRLYYRISDPIRFVEKLWDGTEGVPGGRTGWYPVEKLLRNVVSDAVILVSAQWDIDDILWGDRRNEYRDRVESHIKSRLDALQVGIKVTKLDYIDQSPPWQVKYHFNRAQSAVSNKKMQEDNAEGQQNKILRRAESEHETIVLEAKSYRDMVVKGAEAEAVYIEEVLGTIRTTAKERANGSSDSPAYQKTYNKLLTITLDQLYQEALREVIVNADEVFVVPSTKGQPTEMRMHFSRDDTLGPRNTDQEK